MWLIQMVSVGADGEIDRVQWQCADTERNSWIGTPAVVPVIEVVDAVLRGSLVASVITKDGHSVYGPRARTKLKVGGVETIEADVQADDQRSLLDLPRLR